MSYYSGCDAHKSMSVFVEIDDDGCIEGPTKVKHETGELEEHLAELPEGTPVAFETVGNGYWLADLIEEAGHIPRMTHTRKAKVMMGNTNKTDKLDAQGLAMLQKAGTLPEVWIPPRELRDQREALRFRVKLGQSRIRWKNRIQALLSQYRIQVTEVTDTFGKTGRKLLNERLETLPEQTRGSVKRQLDMLDHIDQAIDETEAQLDEVLDESEEREWVRTIPGIGDVISAIVLLEVGDIERFAGPGNLASYAGTTPREHSSAGRQHYGSVRKDVNQTLKWAMFQAANAVVRHKENRKDSRLVKKYHRVSEKAGSASAKGAVARMIAESVYWVLTKEEPYKEPNSG